MAKIAAKFEKMAAFLRMTAPPVDEPFWNFYHNMTHEGAVRIIDIPLTFLHQGKEIASARFRCIGAPHDLKFVALKKTLEAHPNLKWDHVKINFSQPHAREEITNSMHKNIIAAHSNHKIDSPLALIKEMESIFVKDKQNITTREQLREVFDRQNAKMIGVITGGAYEVHWDKGGPNLLQKTALLLRFPK